jgi:hydrogenase 3 maturation protease
LYIAEVFPTAHLKMHEEIAMGNDQHIFEQLNKLSGSSTVIVGIGNILKGDDAVGPLVCEQLHRAGISARIIDAGIVPENYIQPIVKKAPKNLLLIDAMDFGADPGTIKLFETEQLDSLAISTHTLSPRLFLDMIRQSIELDVYCIGIQPAQTQLGQPVSAQVGRAIEILCSVLVEIFPPGN